jgi:hypothetical protein
MDMMIKSPDIPDAYSGFLGRIPKTPGPDRPSVFSSRKSGRKAGSAGAGATSAIRRGQRATVFFE